ncbi:uncharacterized protein TNCV_748401 [Trichonephila clavipes]|nr:uncharacterized protein TNCV_748401 [Trichonephila clavipes]
MRIVQGQSYDGHLVGSNQLLLHVRKNVRKVYGSQNDKDIVDIGVSYNGSWLTRGHTSNMGVGCVIDLLIGFVIDYEVMSKRCEECEKAKFALEEDSAEFRIWFEGHQNVCSATHVGSSGALEVNAAVKLWERSESIGFRYTTLLSDGDSKSFLELKERNVYGSETQIKKEECINHVSKRLGTSLRPTVKDWRVKDVTLGGKKRGSLKEKTVKKLTRYYTNATRQSKGDVEAMKTAIYATYFIAWLQTRSHNKKGPFWYIRMVFLPVIIRTWITYFRKKRKSANFKVTQQKIKLAKLRRLKIEKKVGPMYKSGGF